MRNRYLRTLVTPDVQAEQRLAYGQSRVPSAIDPTMELGTDERQYIAERDSFYMASVSSDGWPYLQHRGGPKGFLHVVDGRTLAFADYNGNRQLISTGNIRGSHRVSLFLMDYVARERLKLLGEASILAPEQAAELLPQLPVPANAVAERVVRIHVIGFDWNCPKYITQRFTREQVEAVVAPLRSRIAELERQVNPPP